MTELISVAGAGGGCFRRDTQIQLEHGQTVAIQDIKVGQEVLAFDESGNLHVAKVEKLHVHTPQPLLRVQFWRGEIFITPNHWVLNQYSSFVEIQTLSNEDALVDGMGHLRPIINFESIGSESVYNLTVEKYHTFIANNIRVHNGGHRETYPVIAGAMGGGGKGGGGRAAQEDPETLRSKTMVSILDLLGEGQIGGLLNGAQSIYFNETPLQNSDGTYNFNGVSWDARYGTPNQGYIPGYSDIETPFNLSVQCKVNTPVTFTVTNPNADRVRAIVTIPSLVSTDTTTGDLHGTSVEYKFQISPDGGAYTDLIADYVWAEATIGTSDGYMSVTSSSPSASQVSCVVRLNAAAVAPYALNTWGATATLQPQAWTGSTWLSHGPVITLSAQPYSRNSVAALFALNKPLYIEAYVNLPASAARFVPVNVTTGGTLSLIGPKAFIGTPNIVISGKTRARYQRHHLLELPKPATTWNIRMSRITPDSANSAIANDTFLDTYVEIVDAKMSYPNSAVVGVSIDSSLFNKIPNRAYLVDGLYIQVPSNYDPVSRIYSGTWNGTFKIAVSNGNPAWTLYDLLTNARYGLGQYIGEDGSSIDKAALYSIGKYCDELVSDGFDGTEPRFSINTVIQTRAEAYRLITDISSVFQGMSYWAGGMVGFTQDSPQDPGMIYGPANVVDGLFNYVGSARRDRHSVVHVTWNDPLDGYRQKIEYIEDSEVVVKYGIRKVEVVGFGCTSRGQANRIGRWILYSEQYESDILTFGVGLDSALVMPGEIARINNPAKAGKRMAGRVVTVAAKSVTLDAPVTIETAATISFRLPDGTFIDRPVIGPIINSDIITWTESLVTLPLVNSMFIISEEALVPLLARILSIAQDETNKHQYIITAHEHNPSKFAAIENGWSLSKPVTSIVKAKPDAPTNLVLTDVLYRSGANYASKLHASWDDDSQGDLKGWNVRLLGPSSEWEDFGLLRIASLEIPNVTDGQTYRIEVRAVNLLGIQSDAAAVSRTVLGKEANPSNVTGVVAVGNNTGVRLSWVNISDIDLAFYEVREGTVWETATVIGTVNNNFIDLGHQTEGLHTWLVRAKDTTDHYSELDGMASLNVGIPDTPTVEAMFVGNNIEVAWSVVDCDNYFVEIVVAGVVKRSFTTTMNGFSYTLEIATADGGPWRQISVKVSARKKGILSIPGEATSDINAAPVAPTLILVAGIRAVSVTVSRCEDLDYAGTLIYASASPGFTPSIDNQIYEGSTFFMHSDIEGTWYYRAAHYDAYGKSGLNYSIESNALPTSGVAGITTVTELPVNPAAVSDQLAVFLDVEDTTLRGLYGWSGTTWIKTNALLDGSITFEKFDPSISFAAEIEDGEIIAEHIRDGAIAYQKLDPDLMLEIEVEAGEITTTHIADDAISTPKLKAGSVVAAKIAADQITANHLQADSVTTLKIKADQIVSSHIVTNAINATHIQSDSIIASKIKANEISGDKIVANAITTGHIGANQIVASHILAGSVTAEKMTVTDLAAINANMGAITAGSMTLDIAGYIKGGQTDYATGTGFWLGYNAGKYKFSLGGSSGYMLWDGSNLLIRGNIYLGTNNYIQAGQSAYNTGTGFFLGYYASKYRLSIGDPAGKAILWDGDNLTVQGDIIATGNINNGAVSQVGNAYTGGAVPIARNGVWTDIQYVAFNKVTSGPVLITMFCRTWDQHSVGTTMRFNINGVTQYENYIPAKFGGWSDFYFQFTDYGAAGFREYVLTATGPGRPGEPDTAANAVYRVKAYNISITATELKR